jgi:membrane-associated protease RseP (regulator of RpoE activity)
MEIVGIVVFALGIVISIALHEAGHFWSARAFGMKVTRFFIGFGPTLFAWRRKGVEYGLKAIPAGAFVKIVGMTPQDDDVEPGDEDRAMWRFPVWKRTVVMAAGSLAHFSFAIVILWMVFAFVPLPQPELLQQGAVTIHTVAQCTEPTVVYDPATKQLKQCDPATDPQSVAMAMGLQPGDKILTLNGQPVNGWDALTSAIRASGGQQITLTIGRGDATLTRTGTLPTVLRLKQSVINSDRPASSITDADLEPVGVLGVTPVTPTGVYGPVRAFGLTGGQTGQFITGTFSAMGQFPEKIPKLFSALSGGQRDPETPISVVGASRIGGQLFQAGQFPLFLLLLAALNFFVGIFNLLPLLPLDGGHIAVAWFEKARSWVYARLRRPDPGRVDYMKLMPVTYAVILLFGGFTLLTVAADIVNPITLLP